MRASLGITIALAAGTFVFAQGGESLTSLSSWSPASVIAVSSVIFTAGIMWNQHRAHGSQLKRLSARLAHLDDWKKELAQPRIDNLQAWTVLAGPKLDGLQTWKSEDVDPALDDHEARILGLEQAKTALHRV